MLSTQERAAPDAGRSWGENSFTRQSKERWALLLEVVTTGEEINVEDLATRFEVSASTIRRDLQQLSSPKAIKRTYGGAILVHLAGETSLSHR